MKKTFILLIAIMILLVTACSKKPDLFVTVETEGLGQIAVATKGEKIEFDEEYPIQSFYSYVKKGDTLTLAAKQQYDDYMFVKWKVNGVDYSTEEEVQITIEEESEIIAVFAMANAYDGPTASSIDEVKIIGNVLGLPNYGHACYEDKFVIAFELDGTVYRAIAPISSEDSQKIFDLEFDDPDYDEKYYGLIENLTVEKIDNISEAIPSQEELDQYVGKTGKVLTDEGWYYYYYNLETNEFGMTRGWFSCVFVFDGKIEYKENEDIDVDETIKDLKIVSVTYDGFGDLTDLEEY